MEEEKLDGNLHKVTVTLYNSRLMPTMSQAAVVNKVQRPDILTIDGNVKVLAAGQKPGTSMPAGIPARFRRFLRGMTARESEVTVIDRKDLKNLVLENGIPGNSEAEYQFLVEGKGKVTITLDCQKGGKHTESVTLK